jgi:uncharacterized membrane protein YdjX (TVP38/TMEM64 family)
MEVILKMEFKLNKKNIISIIILIIVIGLVVAMCIMLIPLLRDIAKNYRNPDALRKSMSSYGLQSAFIIMLLQALQIITTIFPTIAIQTLAGVAYGTVYGMLICLVGIILGNFIVMYVMRKLGNIFLPIFRKKKRTSEFNFIKSSKRVGLLVFLLFIIPGIPNGILPYYFANARISIRKYLMYVTLASIPSILSCTLIGESAIKGNYKLAGIIALVLFIAAIMTLLYRKKILKYFAKKG